MSDEALHVVPYSNPQMLVADRVRWARAMLARQVAEARVAGLLEGDAGVLNADPCTIAEVIAARVCVTPPHPTTAPMVWLASQLGLEAPDLDALWLLIAIEIDVAVAKATHALSSNECPEMNLQLWRMLVPVQMRRVDMLADLGLIEISTDRRLPLHRRAVRANDRLLEIASGELRLDREVRHLATLDRLPPLDPGGDVRALADSVRNSITAPFLFATGAQGSGRSRLLRNVAAVLGVGVLAIKSRRLSRDSAELTRQLRVIAREACLFSAIPIFQGLDDDPEHPILSMIDAGFELYEGPVFCTARNTIRETERPIVAYDLQPPTNDERAAIWKCALPGGDESLLEEVSARYTLRPGAIIASARNALASCSTVDALDASIIHAGVRAEIGERIGTSATRVECTQTWDDLVLPVDQLDQVAELVARVRQRRRVLSDWGFAKKIGKGFGIASLFSGPPGTGKTMVAGLIAKELGLDLYQVDLSKIVSKYIGETEKQLATLFDAAETGQAIILFDEADSLFAKRSEVKSSNDRYANLEVNYLLQRMEVFTGITILTTNHEKSIDEAFRRRLAIQVRFPMPDETQREGLWRAMIPSQASVASNIDFARLARDYAMSGGYVKNAVLRAAYIAADQDVPISMAHLWQAGRAEYEAMGKVVRG